MKFVLTAVGAAVLLQGCSVSQPDVTPIGDGLKAIGISLVVYGVIKALVRLVRADDRKAGPKPRTERRKTPDTKPARGGEA